jgi:hypothetical protein
MFTAGGGLLMLAPKTAPITPITTAPKTAVTNAARSASGALHGDHRCSPWPSPAGGAGGPPGDPATGGSQEPYDDALLME